MRRQWSSPGSHYGNLPRYARHEGETSSSGDVVPDASVAQDVPVRQSSAEAPDQESVDVVTGGSARATRPAIVASTTAPHSEAATPEN
jgi:hypothetical protein